jgi:hypothetical protein
MVMQVAQDTFVAEVDGHDVQVFKGSQWPDSHPVVAKDEGRGVLFRSLDDMSAPHPVAEG